MITHRATARHQGWTRKGTVTVLTAGAVAAVLLWHVAGPALRYAAVPLLQTPAFIAAAPSADNLVLRSEPDGSLLLSYSTYEETEAYRDGSPAPEDSRAGRGGYRYDPAARSLQPITEDVWEAAEGGACFCGRDLDRGPISSKPGGGLMLHSTPIHTVGASARATGCSRHTNLVAVVSGDGFDARSGHGATGQHYLQFFSLTNAKPVGETLRLPLTSEREAIKVCWSEDDRYVVCYDILMSRVCVVPVGANAGRVPASQRSTTTKRATATSRSRPSTSRPTHPPNEAQPAPLCTQPTADSVDLSKDIKLDLGHGVESELILIPAGEFMMGSTICKRSSQQKHYECPQHLVRICKPFYIGKYEVTQAEWVAVMGANPSHFKGDRLPAETVSWNDCQEFCRKLSAATGRIVRLPSEAEWEYACRGGTSEDLYLTPHPPGDQ